MTRQLSSEEEFFAVEGRPEPCASRACAYIAGMEKAPSGDCISTQERAALWYLAYWSRDGVTQPSIAALAMHVDCFQDETRQVLLALMFKGVLRQVRPLLLEEWRNQDVHVYEFAELREFAA